MPGSGHWSQFCSAETLVFWNGVKAVVWVLLLNTCLNLLVSSTAFSENTTRHKYARRHFPVKDAWSGSMNTQVSVYFFANLRYMFDIYIIGM